MLSRNPLYLLVNNIYIKTIGSGALSHRTDSTDRRFGGRHEPRRRHQNTLYFPNYMNPTSKLDGTGKQHIKYYNMFLSHTKIKC